MVGKDHEKNTRTRFFGGKSRLPQSRRLQLNSALEELVKEYGSLDLVSSQVEIMRSESTTATGGGDVSGSGHDGSSAGGAGVVSGSSQASNTGNNRHTGPKPKPSGSGIGSFADSVRRDGREKTSSGGAGIVPGSSQASNTGNNRPTGPKPKSSGAGIGSLASTTRRSDRENTQSVKGKSSSGISKDQPWKDKPQKGHVQQSLTPRALAWVTSTYEEAFLDDKNKRSARRLVNNSDGEGVQSRVACVWNNSIRANVVTDEDVVDVLHEGNKYWPHAKGFYLTLHPINPDHFDSVKETHTRSMITYDHGLTREGKLVAVPDYVIREPVKGSEDGCAKCGNPSHDISLCLTAHNAQQWVTIPQGVTGDLAKMYLRLANEFRDIPTVPQSCDGLDMLQLAVEIAPILDGYDAKENLVQFLDAGNQNWHCLGQVLKGDPHCEINGESCLTHGTGCIKVRVIQLDEKVLDFID
ncbi:uncharacterized protein FTOL_08626 [Fusarium torulosum]|uniref:Uncharacterized protein n=1 Tax=Fusarium torulosum TaxID=33205 RepID=A0AAE8MCX3_9HYPO|nr:uncharacterized protein FTOL_08626 [Fusarium torulosum]